MPEQYLPTQQPETNLAAEQAERLGVGAERQAACADLVGECSETANKTPEGRLQLVCAQEGLSLQDTNLSVLLEHPDLRLPFGRPLPMPPRIREKCVAVLQKELGIEVREELPPISEAVADRQAILADEVATEGKAETRETEIDQATVEAETRVAGKEETLATTEAERDASAADISEIIKTRVSSGNLAHYRAETTKVLKSEYDGDALADALAVAEGVFAKHEQTLNAMQAVFTPEEIQTVFGGSLTNTVSLNLRGETNAQIYADVFTRIDAGFADDDRRREVRAAVEAQLGIKPHPVDVDSGGDVNDVFKRGYGTETYVDENGETQERNVPIGPGFEVDYKDGHKLGIDERGQKYMSVHTHVGRNFRINLPDNPLDSEMGAIIRTAETRAMLHTMNMAEAFFPSVTIEELDGGMMDIQPSDYAITDKILEATLGNRIAAGNALLTSSDIDQNMHLFQFHAGKSDAVQGDVNPEQIRAEFIAQGAMNKDRSINWERFAAMMESNRNGMHVSEENFANTAKDEAA